MHEIEELLFKKKYWRYAKEAYMGKHLINTNEHWSTMVEVLANQNQVIINKTIYVKIITPEQVLNYIQNKRNNKTHYESRKSRGKIPTNEQRRKARQREKQRRNGM